VAAPDRPLDRLRQLGGGGVTGERTASEATTRWAVVQQHSNLRPDRGARRALQPGSLRGRAGNANH
jgi:hypothetical protein